MGRQDKFRVNSRRANGIKGQEDKESSGGTVYWESIYFLRAPQEGVAKSQREISVRVGKGIGTNMGWPKGSFRAGAAVADGLWPRWRGGKVV